MRSLSTRPGILKTRITRKTASQDFRVKAETSGCLASGKSRSSELILLRIKGIRVARYRQERPLSEVTLVNQLLLDFLQLSQVHRFLPLQEKVGSSEV